MKLQLEYLEKHTYHELLETYGLSTNEAEVEIMMASLGPRKQLL